MADEPAAQPLTVAAVGPLLRRVHHTLVRHRDEIDDLNVFPVPDGDTGSNLVQTVRAAVEGWRTAEGEQAVEAMMRGALMGARGNSGVIFSQVLRAFGEAAQEHADDPVRAYAHALRRATDLAYEAVAEPVEGTMLTAIRVGAEAAEAADARGLERLSAQVVAAVSEAVQRSRLQLDANREAGVVDAGARGFEVCLQAIHDHITGAAPSDDAPAPIVARDRNRRVEREDGSEEYRYEVQYLLHADESHAGDVRTMLAELGDSVVVIGAGDIMNVHVHTNRIGEAIEVGVAFGEPARIEVTEFEDDPSAADQTTAAAQEGAEDVHGDVDASELVPPRLASERAPRRPVAPVVVLDGAGLTALAEELEATVVSGTAGRLPTVADLLNAIAHTNGETVAILPGHPNVVPTAHQASAVSVAEGGRELVVIDEAHAPPAVLAALAVCDPTAEADQIVAEMRQAAGGCRCGEVVAAVRDARTPVGPVQEGQALAVVDGEVTAACDDPIDACVTVVRALVTDTAEVVTVILGADVDDDERTQVEKSVHDAVGDGPEIDVIDGGQRPQRYHLGVE